MEKNKFNTLIDEIAQEFNEDAQEQLNHIKNILNGWEEAIKSSSQSTVEILECHYKSLIRHRIGRLKKLLNIDCTVDFIIRELTLCRQSYDEYLNSTYAKRIIELRG